LDDLRYKHFKARLIRLTTAKEEHRNMYEKPLLNMYQTSSEPKQEREKWKWDEEKKPNHGSDNCGKRREPTYTPRSNWEKKFQNNCEVLVGVPQAKIDQYKADKASCWYCRCSSHHMLECFVKKTSKGTELAPAVVAVSKKAKY
jgi:predicted ATP-binding protein involved in virulence